MSEWLEVTIDKFIFRVRADCWYSPAGLWLRPEGPLVRLGVSDFLQQVNGDVAFVHLAAAGERLEPGDYLGEIETIKAVYGLDAPVSGVLRAVNPALEDHPELVNSDPYGAGWLALLEPADWEAERSALLDAAVYLEIVRREAEQRL